MSKTLVWFGVAVRDLVACIVFGAVVVGELNDSLAIGPMIAV